MALTFTTGMTLASAADSVTNWAVTRFAGSGQAPAAALDTTVFREGTGSIGGKLAGNNWNAATLLDWYANSEGGKSANTTVNLSTAGNEVIAMWVQNTTPGVSLTQAADGMYLIVSSSTDSGTTNPTVYSEWTVFGSDEYPGGWQLLMVDTRKTPTQTVGGGANLTAVRRIGFGNRNVASVGNVKADNVYVDACWYGRPVYTLDGDGVIEADWDDFLTESATNEDGLIESVNGTLQLSCGIAFGVTGQSGTTTFKDSTGTKVIFKRYTYENGTSVVDALNYADYYKIEADGSAGFSKTTVEFGTVVGTGDDRQGVQGGAIGVADSANMTYSIDFDTNVANFDSIKLYGMEISGAHETIGFDDNSVTSLISVNFINCGEITPGSTNNGAELLNIFVIDPDSNIDTENRGLRFKSGTTNTKQVTFITSGTPTTQHMAHLPDTGTVSYTFTKIKFFGSYTSGTLWHGEDSADNTNTITINATDSNPTQSEFATTGAPAGTVAVVNTVTLTIRGVTSDNEPTTYARVSMHLLSDNTEIFKTDASTVDDLNAGMYKGTFSYNYGGDVQVRVKARYSSTGGTKYKDFFSTQTIIDTGLDVTAVWIKDTIAT